MRDRPNIAFLCSRTPLPLTQGARVRAHGVVQALQQMGVVRIGVVGREGTLDEEIDLTSRELAPVEAFRTLDHQRQGIVARLRRAVDTRWIAGRDTQLSDEARRRLDQLLAWADGVWVHTLRVADRTGIDRWPASVMDLDDLHSAKLDLEAQHVDSLPLARHKRWSSQLWRRWEHDAFRRFTAVCVCSDSDAALLRPVGWARVIPNAFDCTGLLQPRSVESSRPRLGFIGTLKYHANADGLRWFLDAVFEPLREAIPNLELRVVGLLPPASQWLDRPGVRPLGFIDDPSAEMATWHASIVPLRIGGGTRIKILDCAARGIPLVSTTLGAFGLGFANGRELLLADDAEDFANACQRMMEDQDLASTLASHAHERVVNTYDWQVVGHEVRAVMATALSAEPVAAG